MTAPTFDEILDEMKALHAKKHADYGSGTDEYANFHSFKDFGVAPWIGVVLRISEKMARLKSFTRNGRLENESVLDSLQDISVLAIIAQILYQEEYGQLHSATPQVESDIGKDIPEIVKTMNRLYSYE
jgi:hypothetical protein